MVAFETSLFGLMACIPRSVRPPVPTTNWRIPKAGSATPLAVCGREPLVVVVVSAQEELDAVVVEGLGRAAA